MKIGTYLNDIYVDLDDKLLGTDGETGATKNYPISSILSVLESSLDVAFLGFKFSDGSDVDISEETEGYFTTNLDKVLSTEISSIKMNKTSYGGYDITNLLTLASLDISSFVLKLQKASTSNEFFYFTIDSIVDSGNYYTISVSNLVGNNSLGAFSTYSVGLELRTSVLELTATNVVFDPYSSLTSDNAQDAIQELKDEVDALSLSTGSGDMLKSTYDTTNNGIVDNSEGLGGNNSTWHISRTNHTGTQTASTISDFDTEVANNSAVAANTAKVGFSNLTGDVTSVGAATTIAVDAVDIPMLSATGTPSSSTYLRGDNTWSSLASAGLVTKVGTPVNNQIGVWTGDGTLEGDSGLTFDGSLLKVGTSTVWHTGNDGSASGLDADTLDGIQASAFLRSDTSDTHTGGTLTFNTRPVFNGGTSGSLPPFTVDSTFKVTNLNADLLDGIDVGSLLRSDTSDQFTSGTLTFNDNTKIGFGTSNGEGTLWSNGSATYWDMGADKDLYIRDVTTTRFTFDSSGGNFTATGQMNATSYFETSDITLKKNIQPISDTFSSFEFKSTDGKRYGVIAQEIEKTNPELVSTDKEGLKSVNYIDLLVMKVAELENEIKLLKNR